MVATIPGSDEADSAAGSQAALAAMDANGAVVVGASAEGLSSKLPVEIAWSFNPWRANWRRPALALAIELAAAVGAGWSFSWPHFWPQALGWGGISILLLFGMTAAIFIPASYKLDAQGVLVNFLGAPSFRKWEHYRNFYVHDTGVHLTTMPKPSGLDPFRGHYLQYGLPGSQGEKALVVPFIREHMRLFLGQPPAA